MGLHTIVSEPTITYGDNAAALSVIESKRMTPRVRHFDIPIAYLHEHRSRDTFIPQKVCTQLQLADLGTKPHPPIVLRRLRDWGFGVRYYPSSDTLHYEYLGLRYYGLSFTSILQEYS